jgi:hypothetical protein
MKLQRGDSVPHFQVATVGGELFKYDTIWQRRNLVLAIVGASAADDQYARTLDAKASVFRDHDTTVVVTPDEVPGLSRPAVLIADKWGEIVHVSEVSDSDGWPGPTELLDWVDYVRRRCPECEGEAR